MSSSYRKTVEKLNEQAGDGLPCAWCHTLTQRSVLSHLGARCQSCFDGYCEAPKLDLHPRGMPGPRSAKLDLSFAKRAEVDLDKAKVETANRVAQYAAAHGIP